MFHEQLDRVPANQRGGCLFFRHDTKLLWLLQACLTLPGPVILVSLLVLTSSFTLVSQVAQIAVLGFNSKVLD